jgi:hypothetical protein
MKRRSRFLMIAAVALMAAACGSDDDTQKPARGTAQKGEACTIATDCAEPSAVCINGATCSGPIDGQAFTTECAAGGAADCAGLRCLGLAANKQNKTGLCSMACSTDADCGGAPIGACVSLQGTPTCLKPCSSSSDCFSGFVCVPDPDQPSRSACLVEPA